MKRLPILVSLIMAVFMLIKPVSADTAAWHWLNPLPRGNFVSAVSCPRGGPCYAAGSNGTMLLWREAGQHWTMLPSGQTADFQAIDCPTPTACYALSGNTVFTTTNGARSWTRHPQAPTFNLSRLSCPNQRRCYALGGDLTYECHVPGCQLHGKENVLLRTGDAGKTRQRLNTGDTPALDGLTCPIERTCWVVGEGGTVLVTRNAGASFQQLAKGQVSPGISLHAVGCERSSQCFVGGDGVLLLTLNNGRSWARLTPPNGIHFGFLDLTCANLAGCLGLGSSRPGRRQLYQHVLLALSAVPGRPHVAIRGAVDGISIACSSPRFCHTAGGPLSPSTSTDGGRSWRQWAHGDREDLQRITCPTALICRAVGKGSIVATDDGGSRWMARGPVVGDDYGNGSGLLCPDARLCYATRSFGRILISHDGGRTWRNQRNPYSGTAVEFNGISCPSRQVCFTIGIGCHQDPCHRGENPANVVLTTANGGLSWRRVYTTQARAFVHAIACPSVRVCYVVGGPGIVMVTKNGGLNWQNLRNHLSGSSADLSGISCVDTQTCITVGYGCVTSFGCSEGGEAGIIQVTRDGGKTWRATRPPVPAADRSKVCSTFGCPSGLNLSDVACASRASCWVVGAMGFILHTVDGGDIWRRQHSGTDLSLLGIACPGIDRCYAVGQGGAILGLNGR